MGIFVGILVDSGRARHAFPARARVRPALRESRRIISMGIFGWPSESFRELDGSRATECGNPFWPGLSPPRSAEGLYPGLEG